jgi:hypothetical protein
MYPAGYEPAFPIPVLRKGDICMSIVYVGLDLGSSNFHARLTVQRKIVSTLRAMWLNQTPYGDQLMR